MPITGTPMKNISVPHASKLCHPSVSTKLFKGNRPMETTANENKAIIRANAMQPRIKYANTLNRVTIMFPIAPLVRFAA